MKLSSLSRSPWIASILLAALAPVQAENEGNNEGKANPYESIVDRNPFALKPPPPPAPPDMGPPAPPPPLATVELTGVTSIFSKKKALVEIVPGPGKPPMKLTLDEGERVDAITIVSIDVDKAEVTIDNAGSVTNIGLKVVKAGASPPPPGVPGIPGMPQPPGIVPTIPTAINPTANQFTSSGSRGAPIIAGGAATPAVPNYGNLPNFGQPNALNANPGGVYTGAGAGNTTPGLINRPIRTQAPAAQTQAPVDPAVQYINMAAQKQIMEAKGIHMPPLPPVQGLEP